MIIFSMILQWLKAGLDLALKHWKITLVVIACIAIYIHAIVSHRKVVALENEIIGLQATVDQYQRMSEVQQEQAKKQARSVVKQVAEVEKQKVVIDERIKYIYKTDPVSAQWATTPVPDAVADQLRNH